MACCVIYFLVWQVELKPSKISILHLFHIVPNSPFKCSRSHCCTFKAHYWSTDSNENLRPLISLLLPLVLTIDPFELHNVLISLLPLPKLTIDQLQLYKVLISLLLLPKLTVDQPKLPTLIANGWVGGLPCLTNKKQWKLLYFKCQICRFDPKWQSIQIWPKWRSSYSKWQWQPSVTFQVQSPIDLTSAIASVTCQIQSPIDLASVIASVIAWNSCQPI